MHRLVVALVTLIGLTGAAVVGIYLVLFSAATDDAAALVPEGAVAYVNVHLQPSTGQQMNLAGLVGRLPGFADEAALDEKIDQVVQNLLSSSGIDYREQVKPWLGDQVALAAWAGAEGSEPIAVLIAAVRDREAAEEALAGLAADGGAPRIEAYGGVDVAVTADGAYGFVGEMLVAGPDAAAVRTVIDTDAGGASLADRSDFVATMAGLEPDHLAAAFLDLAGLAEATGASEAIAGMTTAGAVLVAEADGLRLSGSAPFDAAEAGPSARAGFALGGEPSSLAGWMPEDTIAEVVVFGLRRALEDAESAASELPEGEELGSTLDTMRAVLAFGLGIDLDADVLPLLDREVGVALTGVGEGGLPSGVILLRPEDAGAAAGSLERLADALAGAGAELRTESAGDVEVTVIDVPETGEAAYALADGIVIIGLSGEDVASAIEAHATGESLAATPAYGATFEVAGTRAGNEAWVDVGAVVELLDAGAALPTDARDILLRLGTFGFTAPSADDQIEFHAVLTVDDPQDD